MHAEGVVISKKDANCAKDLSEMTFFNIDRAVKPVEDISEAFAGLSVSVDPDRILPDIQGLKITD